MLTICFDMPIIRIYPIGADFVEKPTFNLSYDVSVLRSNSLWHYFNLETYLLLQISGNWMQSWVKM